MTHRDRSSLLSLRGRLRRARFWPGVLALTATFALAFVGIEALLGRPATLVLYPPAAWLALRMGARRYHDLDRSAWWLLMLLVPLLGPLVVGWELLFRRGSRGENHFGPDPRQPVVDYHTVR